MKTIQYRVSYENMISRLPGLFAYLESDDFGVISLHSAIESTNGCYGKIIENIKLPVSLIVEENTILEKDKTYTFRTIISNYYQYREQLDSNDDFIMFIEKGIGKITLPSSKFENYPAAPKFVYLSNVRNLYNELVKISKQCKYYYEHKQEIGNDKHLCCLCERYENMGGDILKEEVKSYIPMAETISTEYLDYAKNIDKGMQLEFNVDLTSSYEDLGIMTPSIAEWLPYKRYYTGDKVFYDGKIKIVREPTEKELNSGIKIIETTGKWDEDLEKVVFDKSAFNDYESGLKKDIKIDEDTDYPTDFDIEGQTDSKLTDLRRNVTYLNDDNVAERPEKGRDWLFYYRIGLVVNITTSNDEFGNILTLSGETATSSNDSDKLAAYGDVITNISADEENKSITFEYMQGVHLKASYAGKVTDDDGNDLHKWKDFVLENKGKTGIKYQETYNYVEGEDLDKLVNGTFEVDDIETGATVKIKFDDYVNGNYDKSLSTYKFEFVTFNNTITYTKLIANQEVNIVSIITDFEIHRDDFDEFMRSDLIRQDYFNGISYAPTKDIDVHIERGSTSVFDKHLSFGEIKTLEDLENFKNSSFFKMNNG